MEENCKVSRIIANSITSSAVSASSVTWLSKLILLVTRTRSWRPTSYLTIPMTMKASKRTSHHHISPIPSKTCELRSSPAPSPQVLEPGSLWLKDGCLGLLVVFSKE